MNSKEILIVTRCFWPQSGLTELAIAELAVNLKLAGHRITIASVRWSRNWSEHIDYHGIPVIRFAKPVNGPWSSFRFARLLSKHLATKSYDAVIVSGVGDEAAATLRCVDSMTPVIIRVDGNLLGVQGNLHRKHVENCLGASAVVANSTQIASTFERVDEMPKVHLVRDGMVPQKVVGDSVTKRQIREALSLAHPVLQIKSQQPLAITFVPFTTGSGLLELVDNWSKVLLRLPDAKLWLLGDGPGCSQVWQRILRHDITHAVVLPGYFDSLRDLFLAADLYIHPAATEDPCDGLIRAMAAGIPAVSTAVEELRGIVELDSSDQIEHGFDWSRLILDHLVDRDLEVQPQKTSALRHTIGQYFSPQLQMEQYLRLMDSAITDQVAIAK